MPCMLKLYIFYHVHEKGGFLWVIHLILIVFSIGITIDIFFHWYQNVKISIAITYFQFHMVSKSCDILKILFMYKWYIKICFITLIIIKICLSIITTCVKNVLICIAYMQGELNISSIYRFMLNVSCIEELDISSLCDTRV